VQTQILEQYPDADLRVYVVWLPVLAQDSRFEVDDLVVDARATHYWDNDQVVSDALSSAFDSGGGVVWDVYFLFGPDATWNERPPKPLATGAPVVSEIAGLESALRPYLG
jgi:hypothetical protein